MEPLEIGPMRAKATDSTESDSVETEDFFAAMVAAVENNRRHQQENTQFAQLEVPTPDVAEISEALHRLETRKPFE